MLSRPKHRKIRGGALRLVHSHRVVPVRVLPVREIPVREIPPAA